MSGGRITPREVVFAFRKTGLQPIAGFWGKSFNGGCGCALTALVALAGGVVVPEGSTKKMVKGVSEVLSLESVYVEGFIQGFDDLAYRAPEFEHDTTYKRGLIDGTASRQAVIR